MRIRKPAHLGVKLLLLGLLCSLLFFWVAWDLPCIFRRLTGLPCISCGLSRAWLAALRLKLGEAFQHHPMFWSIPALGLYALYDWRLFPRQRLDRWIFGLLAAGWLVSYAFRLVVFLRGGDAF